MYKCTNNTKSVCMGFQVLTGTLKVLSCDKNVIHPGRPLTGGTDTGGTRSDWAAAARRKFCGAL